MHALWTVPPGDEDFSYCWRVIKRMVTQRCQTRLNRPEWMNARRRKRNQSTLWQHRFWEHLMRDEADFNRHIDYIQWNPVKHGYVAQVRHWPYSSFHRYVNKRGCRQVGESTSNHSTALTSANELARTGCARHSADHRGAIAPAGTRKRSRSAFPFGKPGSMPATVPATSVSPWTLAFVLSQFCGLNTFPPI